MICSFDVAESFIKVVDKEIMSNTHKSMEDLIKALYKDMKSNGVKEADIFSFLRIVPTYTTSLSAFADDARQIIKNYTDQSNILQLIDDFKEVDNIAKYLNVAEQVQKDWHSNNATVSLLKKEVKDNGLVFDNKAIVVNRRIVPKDLENAPEGYVDDSENFYDEVALVKIGNRYYEIATRRKPIKGKRQYIPVKGTYTQKDLDAYTGEKRSVILDQLDTKTIEYVYDYQNLTDLVGLKSRAMSAFKSIYSSINVEVKDVKFVHFEVATNKGLKNTNSLFGSLPTLVPYRPDPDTGKFYADPGTLALEPGSSFAVVEVVLQNRNTNTESKVYQVIKLVGKKLEESDSTITNIKTFLSDVVALEKSLADLGFPELQYGTSETFTEEIEGETANFYWHSAFVHLLGISPNTIMYFPKLKQIKDAIDASPAKDTIYKQLAAVNNHVVTTTNVDPYISKIEKEYPTQNKNLSLEGTKVKKLDRKKVENLLVEKTVEGVNIYDAFTNAGFEFVHTASSGGMLEARKTFEIKGISPSGGIDYIHGMISYSFNVSFDKKKGRVFLPFTNDKGEMVINPEVQFFKTTEKEIQQENVKRVYEGEGSNVIRVPARNLVYPKNTLQSIKVIKEVALNALLHDKKSVKGATQESLDNLVRANSRIKTGNTAFSLTRTRHQIDETTTDSTKINHIKRLAISLKVSNPTITLEDGNEMSIREALQFVVDPSNFENGESTHNPTKDGSFGLRAHIPAWGIQSLTSDLITEDNELKTNASDQAKEVYSNLRSGFTTINPTKVSIKETGKSVAPGTTKKQEDIESFSSLEDELDSDPFEELDDDVKEFTSTDPIDSLGFISTPEEALAELKRLMPDMSEKELNINFGMLLINGVSSKNFGAYLDGMIYLQNGEKGISKIVLRHEAFHRIFDLYLPSKVRTNLIKKARKELSKNGYPNPSLIEIEEYLAGLYQIHKKTPIEETNVFKKFFAWLSQFLKRHLSFLVPNKDYIEQVLSDIEKGKYAKRLRVPSKRGDVKWMKNITKHFLTGNNIIEAEKREVEAIRLLKKISAEAFNDPSLFVQDLLNKIAKANHFLEYLDTADTVTSGKLKDALNDLKSQGTTLTRDSYKRVIDELLHDLRNNGKEDYGIAFFLFTKAYFQNQIFKTKEGTETIKALMEDIFEAYDLKGALTEAKSIEEISKEGEEEQEEQPEDEDLERGRVNLTDEIAVSKRIDATESLTRILKARFKFIYNESYNRFVVDRVAFRRISTDLLNTDAGNFEANVKRLANSYAKDSDSAYLYEMLYNQILASKEKLPNLKGVPQNVITYKDGRIFLYTKEVHVNYRLVTIKNKLIDQYSKNILEIINSKYPELQEVFKTEQDIKDYIIAVKKKQEASEFVARIVHEVISQTSTNPVASLVKKSEEFIPEENVRQDAIYHRAKFLSAFTFAAQINNKIVAFIQDKLAEELSVSKLDTTYSRMKQLTPEQIMHLIGLGSLSGDGLTNAQKLDFKNNFLEVIDSARKNLPEILSNANRAGLDLRIADFDRNSDLYNQSALLRAVDALYTNSEQQTALMYRDENNNLRFMQTIGSFVFDVLNGVASEAVNSEIPAFLKVVNWNTKNNIFVNSKNIFKSVDFDYFKDVSKRNENFSATSYERMAPAHMYIHRFFSQFGGVLNSTLSGKLTKNPKYNQFLYIQSDRPSDTGAQIRLAGLKPTAESGMNSLRSIYSAAKKMEEDFYSDPEMAKLKNFNPNNRVFGDKTFNEFLKDKNSDVQEAFMHMIGELDQLYFLNPYTKDTSKNDAYFERTGIEKAPDIIKTFFRPNGVYDYLKQNSGFITNDVTKIKKSIAKALGINYETASKEGKMEYLTSLAKTYQIFEIFFFNNYLNGYHLNSLVFGSTAITKNVDDLIKRMNGVKSPGKKQYINPTGKIDLTRSGNKKFSNLMVLEDVERYYTALTQGARIMEAITGTKAEITDGTTIGTPSTLRNIQRGTGDYNLTDIIKIVSFGHSPKGNTFYLKTALFVITDPLARMFPELATLRSKMESRGLTSEALERYEYLYDRLLNETITDQEELEYQNLVDLNEEQVDYVPFNTAVKVGRNKEISKQGQPFNEESLIQVYNEYIRIQGNPHHDEGSVSNPSQLNYFLPTNQLNYAESFELYSTDAQITNLGIENLAVVQGLIDLNEDGTLNKVNLKKVKQTLINTLEKARDTDPKPYELLKEGLDFTFPSLVTKGIITLANMFNRSAVEIRHSGNKLTAQSSYGVEIIDGDKGPITAYSLTPEQKVKLKAFHALPYNVKEVLKKVKLLTIQDKSISDLLNNKEHLYAMYNLSKEEIAIADKYINLESDELIIPRTLQFRDKNGLTEVIAPKWWLDLRGYKSGDIFTNVDEEAFRKLYEEGISIRIPTTGIHSALAIKIIAGASVDPITKKQTSRIIVPEEIVAIHGSDFDVDALFSIRRELYPGNFKDEQPKDVQWLLDHGVFASSLLPVGYNAKGEFMDDYYEKLENLKDKEDTDSYKLILKYQKKYLLNKKFNIYLDVITNNKNNRTVDTPIEFKYIKEDFTEQLEGMTFKTQEELDNYLELNPLFASMLPEGFSLNYEDVNQNKLILPEEVADMLTNHPDVGVKLKLKILTKRIRLQESRDPNNIANIVKYHKDTFEGAMGIGITATFLKKAGYSLFATPLQLKGLSVDGDFVKVAVQNIKKVEYITEPTELPTTQTDEISSSLPEQLVSYEAKVTYIDENGAEQIYTGEVVQENLELENPIDFFGTKLSYIRYTTFKYGHRTFDIGDTLINGYIDNVKEQITWIINSTGATIEIINVMLFLGLDLDTITYILNQPILKEGAKVNLGVVSRLKREVRDLDPSIESSKLPTPSFEDAVEVLQETYGMTINELKLHMNKPGVNKQKILSVQKYVATNLFPAIKSLADTLSRDARSLSVLRNLPVLPTNILNSNLSLDEIKSISPFKNDNFLNIPSIDAAFNAFELLNNVLAELYPNMSEQRKNNIIDLLKTVEYKTSESNNVFLNKKKNIEFFSNALDDISLSMLIAEYRKIYADFFDTDRYVGVNRLTGKLVESLEPGKFKTEFGYGKKKKTVDLNTVVPLEDQELILQVLLNRVKERTRYIEFEKPTTINGVSYPAGHPVGLEITKEGVTRGNMLPPKGIPKELKDAYEHNIGVNELEQNKFLQLVSIRFKQDGTGLHYIFTRGTKANVEEENALKAAARDLPPDIKFMLLMIDMIQNRSKFGFMGYTNYLDVENTGEFVGLRDVSKRLRQIKESFETDLTFGENDLLVKLLLGKNKGNLGESRTDKLGFPEGNFVSAEDFRNLAYSFQIDPNSNLLKISTERTSDIHRYFNDIETSDGRVITLKYAAILIEEKTIEDKPYYLYALVPESRSVRYIIPTIGTEPIIDNARLKDILKSQSYTRSLTHEDLVKLDTEGTLEKERVLKYAKSNENILKFYERINNNSILVRDYATNIGEGVTAKMTVDVVNDEKNKQYIIKETLKKEGRKQLKAEIPAGEKTVRTLVNRLQRLYNIPVVYDESMTSAGRYQDGKVYINPKLAGKDTPIHEFLHPIIMGLKKGDVGLYNNLLAEIEKLFPSLREQVETTYDSNINEEILVVGLTRLINNKEIAKVPENLLNRLLNFIKSLFLKNKPIDLSTPMSEFIDQFTEGKLQYLLDQQLSDNQETTSIKLGVQELFKENSELASIGTQEQYSQYLDTIFPDSKVKDIVYRGGNLGTKQPQGVEAFTTSKSYAQYRAEQNNTQVYYAILNIKDSKLINKKETRTLSLDRDEIQYEDYGFTDNKDQTRQLGNFYTVKENNRHILGNKTDIEGFKKFVRSSKLSSKEVVELQEYVEDSSITDEEFKSLVEHLKNCK